MPTHNDETLHDRYTREHLTHLARLATMTPDQIAAMELDLHNTLAEVGRLRAQQPSQGGEAVEVVAWRVSHPDTVWKVYEKNPESWAAGDFEIQTLMTVAQHQRIVAAITAPPSPDAELVELLRNKFPRIDPCKPVPLDEKAHCCEYTIYVERERLHRLIDDKMVSLEVKP